MYTLQNINFEYYCIMAEGSGKVVYFDMPQYIKGRQLKSYGGDLAYTIRYRGQGRQTSDAPDVVLSVSYL